MSISKALNLTEDAMTQTPTTAAVAARALLAAHVEGRLMADLPPGSVPMTQVEGYAAQDLLAEHLGEVIGWKAAATTPAGQTGLEISGPLAGRLFAGQRKAAGAPVTLSGNRMCTAEPEIGFVLGSDLAPRSRPRSTEEVLDAVESLQLAWDVPSTRLREPRVAGIGLLLADNAFGHVVVAVRSPCAAWRDLDLAALDVVVTSSEGAVHQGTGAMALGDPRESLTWLVNEVNRYGATVDAGALVITGSLVTPIAVRPGLGLSADLGALGSLSIEFVG
jgi:2-keto-4-pentenoate hydratase